MITKNYTYYDKTWLQHLKHYPNNLDNNNSECLRSHNKGTRVSDMEDKNKDGRLETFEDKKNKDTKREH
jgi:hypothetical protein